MRDARFLEAYDVTALPVFARDFWCQFHARTDEERDAHDVPTLNITVDIGQRQLTEPRT